ncbi:hypothetical protein ABB29_03570 [Pseudoxanthomonas dokdonensis]|uniref:Uncharacterized protein n=1 Tax=Pseudoxanthomonas dokdonensis TaxID=344882 RepID=A0A0R0CZA0_9GAMM|nr:hypothetical protein ABB29_03570 [Pseudoxanthomonas dokdonensis]
MQTADILLMRGTGPLSTLIAWCGDSIYSHAAITADKDDLIEASAVGVRRYPLQKRLLDTDNYYFVDGFRPQAGGEPLSPPDRGSVLAHAVSLLGVPYPLDSLATLGVVVAIRGKLPQHWLARIVVREALDHLVKDNPSHMVCSEVVYRALAECDVTPEGRLAPVIVLTPPTHMPFPPVDWKELWDEVWPLLHPQRQSHLATLAGQLQDGQGSVLQAGSIDPALQVGDDELQQRARQVREQLGLDASPLPQLGDIASAGAERVEMPATVIPHPNPKLVMPLDLAASPSNHLLGRLMDSGKLPPT